MNSIEMITTKKDDHDRGKCPGFRLDLFEIFNWGTFDNRVWTFETRGANSLLTGDIGSGKSTVVDALTTLLVPGGKITYNKAAGAEGKERTLHDYILGHYKKEKGDDTLVARPVFLREGDKTFSVLMGDEVAPRRQFIEENAHEVKDLDI